MGHGTEAASNAVYETLQDQLTQSGHENYYIGTVEAEPSLDTVLSAVQKGTYERVILVPLMIVAGDHANNDMAGEEADGWYIPEAKEAMEQGRMEYAGKYRAPDYELLLSRSCDLAIESTMIYHTPEVKEQLEDFGVPVLVERSSYENHPLGRMEWIKLYGLLLGREDAAAEYFDTQVEKLRDILQTENTGKTVAFFYITSNGAANVRKSGDYLAKAIELAGGTYLFQDLPGEDNAQATTNLQMEAFYAKAKQADVLIYSSTIDGELQTMEELLEKSPVLSDCKAVKEGAVWCTGKNLFQESLGLGDLMVDIHKILTEDQVAQDELTYLHPLR